MARFPKIDRPCPLDADAQLRINGHCGHCGKTVHCLDGKSDAERTELLRKAGGSLCVSYTLTAGIGAALALSMAGPVSAAPAVPDSTRSMTSQHDPDSLVLHASQGEQTPIEVKPIIDLGLDQIMVGGISAPGEAVWVDDDDNVPELPMRHEPLSKRHD